MRGGCSLIGLMLPDLHECTRRPRACRQLWLVMCRVGMWSGLRGAHWPCLLSLHALAQRQRMSGQQLRDSQPEPYDSLSRMTWTVVSYSSPGLHGRCALHCLRSWQRWWQCCE